MANEDRRLGCLEKFLLVIGSIVSGLSPEERRSYGRIMATWEQLKVLGAEQLVEVKAVWGITAAAGA